MFQALRSQYNKFVGEKNGKDMEKFIVAMKTIGNAGMKTFLPPILRILKQRDVIRPPHKNMVVVSAIDALRRMRLNVIEKSQVSQLFFQACALSGLSGKRIQTQAHYKCSQISSQTSFNKEMSCKAVLSLLHCHTLPGALSFCRRHITDVL